MITHRVTIQPTHRNHKLQYYKATFQGEEIVARSADPEFAACRAMQARGFTGRVAFYRAGVVHPGLIIQDLVKAARFRIVEADRVGPVRKTWRPFDMKAPAD